MATQTMTFYPAALGDYKAFGSINSPNNPIGKGSDNSTYSNWKIKNGKKDETYVFYTFDCSSIPEGATITAVTCSAKALIDDISTTIIAVKELQMYTGSTAKGTANTSVSTTATALTIICGEWTRAELQNAQIRFYVERTNSLSSKIIGCKFFGATLTVTFETTKTLTATYNGNTIINEQKSGDVAYSYGGISGTISANQTKTMQCNGKVCSSDIVIGGKTLQCNGELMASDVVINYS